MRYAALVLATLVVAPATRAAVMRWEGRLDFDLLAPGLPTLAIAGTGVATLNGSGGGSHLTALRLAGGLSGSATVPVTDPEITAGQGIVALRAVATFGTATLAPFASGGAPLTRSTLPVRGMLAVCFIDPACLPGGFLPLPLTSNDGATGLGVGGLLHLGNSVRISVLASPWTLGTAFLTVTTNGGATIPLAAAGWAHGPWSFTTSTALPGGALSLVTPLRITSETGPPASSFARLTLRFVPEPGSAVLLGAGVLSLACVALTRRRS